MQAMRNLLEEDTRFKLEAYQFIREALQYAQEHMDMFETAGAAEAVGGGAADSTSRPPKHVTGQQLCEACRQYAIEQYGYLAKIVLASWGIHSTSDFGELVYNLIHRYLNPKPLGKGLGKTPGY